MTCDYLVVGSGLTGATIARLLFDAGYKVLVLDRRQHLGGNVYDYAHESGIRIHAYGPHYFRTSDSEIWKFVNRFATFYDYIPCLKSYVDGNYENWPIASSYIKKTVGDNWIPAFKGKPSNFEEAALSLMPELVYYKFVRDYNFKQWGVDPRELSPDLIKRFDVRMDDDPRLMPKHKYQGIPVEGYAKMMENMLSGIPLMLNVDFLQNRDYFKANKKIVYTGPIDSLFDHCYGKLVYRGQQREHVYFPDKAFVQPTGQVNNPSIDNGPHIRSLEWKHMMNHTFATKIRGTVVSTEITITPDDPDKFEYPFPDYINRKLYHKYENLASKNMEYLICGRLGEYRYYDMDQAIGRAFKLSRQIL